jgi:hypothetical protein
MPPLSLSLCCTKSERRILAAPSGIIAGAKELFNMEMNRVTRGFLNLPRAEQIMVCGGCRVKFAAGLCARFATERGRSGLFDPCRFDQLQGLKPDLIRRL